MAFQSKLLPELCPAVLDHCLNQHFDAMQKGLYPDISRVSPSGPNGVRHVFRAHHHEHLREYCQAFVYMTRVSRTTLPKVRRILKEHIEDAGWMRGNSIVELDQHEMAGRCAVFYCVPCVVLRIRSECILQTREYLLKMNHAMASNIATQKITSLEKAVTGHLSNSP